MMTRVTLLVVASGISILCGCISTTSGPRQSSGSDDAGEQNYTLGAQYFRNGSYDLARDRLERAIAFEPKMAKAHTMLALTHAQAGNVRLATESFEQAVRLAPNDQDVRNAYAVFLCGQEDYDEARNQFDRAIAVRENDNPEVMMSNAGVCMANKPDIELAEQYFRQALERRPSYAEALIQLAALKHRTGDSLTARAFLQRYLARGDLPFYLERRIKLWLTTLKEFANDLTAEPSLKTATTIFHAADTLSRGPGNRVRAVHDIIAASIIRNYLSTSTESNAEELGKAYYILGVIALRTMEPKSAVPEMELLLSASINADPSGQHALEAYALIEEYGYIQEEHLAAKNITQTLIDMPALRALISQQ